MIFCFTMAQVLDLSVRLAGISLRNPVIAASGTFGYGEEFARFADLKQIGGICVKGTSASPIEGNFPPRLFPTASGMLNSIGLENVGVDAIIRDKMPFLRKEECTIFVNVFGSTEHEYVEVVQKLNGCEGIAGYELNISCPNTERGGMVFGTNPGLTTLLTRRVKDLSRRPVIVKLSPNVTDIVELAKAAVEGGADALSVANTFLGMAIDPETFRPRIHTITAGLSGPAIKPITLRMVYQITKALPIPVIGVGGITSGMDAVEYFLAGATAIQVGTTNFQDPRSPIRVLGELQRFMEKRGLTSLTALIGKMKS
jgi:dihydroorotate dehydrogenase (NAD+) catalytic subunit